MAAKMMHLHPTLCRRPGSLCVNTAGLVKQDVSRNISQNNESAGCCSLRKEEDEGLSCCSVSDEEEEGLSSCSIRKEEAEGLS